MKAFVHASEILTGAGVRAKDGRRVVEADLGRIEDGAIVYDAKKIAWVGPTKELPKKYARVSKKNLRGRQAIVPGLVDCHTHLVFAGDRSDEFALRCGGATYEQIAQRGGGIVASVKATREASAAELERLAVPVLDPRRRPQHPLRVVSVQMDRAVEAVGPLDHRRVVVRVRDRDPGEAAAPLHFGGGLLVEERDAVPEQVRAAIRDEQGALPDRERRLGADADEAGVVADPVASLGAQLGERRPTLAALGHVLTRVGADRAEVAFREVEALPARPDPLDHRPQRLGQPGGRPPVPGQEEVGDPLRTLRPDPGELGQLLQQPADRTGRLGPLSHPQLAAAVGRRQWQRVFTAACQLPLPAVS